MAFALPSRPSLDWLRKTARQRLRELRASQPDIKLAAVQLHWHETMVSQAGVRLRPTWNSYKVVGRIAERLSCSFCGKSQHEVRGLIEGACSTRATSACVFICDEWTFHAAAEAALKPAKPLRDNAFKVDWQSALLFALSSRQHKQHNQEKHERISHRSSSKPD